MTHRRLRVPRALVRRSTALGITAALLGATTLAACGGDSGGGSDDKSVTIWASVDQPIIDGFQKHLDAAAEDAGLTVKFEKVENINQLIMTKIQANDTPDIAFIPQPGVVKDIVSRDAAQPLNDVVDMDALTSTMVPGALEAGTVEDQLYGMLVSANCVARRRLKLSTTSAASTLKPSPDRGSVPT